MIINFELDIFGYSVGGHNNKFEIEIDDNELAGESKEEQQIYIDKCVYDYILNHLEFWIED